MQYVFFEKGVRSVQWCLRISPEAGEISRIFVLKVTLQSYNGGATAGAFPAPRVPAPIVTLPVLHQLQSLPTTDYHSCLRPIP